jgi:hypothetical protein
MRFSLKWLLAGMAYVALAAAAISQESQTPANFLWAVTIAVGFCALMAAVYSRGAGRAYWIGFVGLFAINGLFLHVAPSRMPSNIVVTQFGYDVTTDGRVSRPGYGTYAAPVIRVPNAVGTMIAGLIGGALATVEYRRHGQR